MEVAVALDFSTWPLRRVEEVAFELLHLAAAQAGHVHVVALRTALVEVAVAFDVQQVELVRQALALEQAERAIDGDAIDVGIDARGLVQDLRAIEVL